MLLGPEGRALLKGMPERGRVPPPRDDVPLKTLVYPEEALSGSSR